MLLQIAGAGDELQGIKRGIMEMADLVAITKADGNNILRAELAKTQFVNALNLFPTPESGWRPRVYTCSSVEKKGLKDLWSGVEDFLAFTKKEGYYKSNRNNQDKYWMFQTINESLKESFYRLPAIEEQLAAFEEKVLGGQLSSFVAANQLMNIYFDKISETKK